MDYIGNQCPVCHKYFHVGDDVVVCPECGTPHHRECYESTGHCCNEHLHTEGFEYDNHTSTGSDVKICPSCGKENQTTQFFCTSCGSPLSPDTTQQDKTDQQGGNTAQGFPFGMGGNVQFNEDGTPFIDPLGGVPADTDLGDGVTAGEAAKYVKQNTPYYIRIFSNIKNFNSGKFNFMAAIFPGGYMLYRKMYKLGAFFASMQMALLLIELYIQIAYSSLLQGLNDAIQSGFSTADRLSSMYAFMQELSIPSALTLYLYSMIDFINIAIMIVVGICFNRMYFKHCKKQIIRIKESAKEDENPDTLLQTKGGVNIPLTISYFVAYMVVSFVIYFI